MRDRKGRASGAAAARKKMKGIAQSPSKRWWLGSVNFPREITQPRSFSRKPLRRGELGGRGGRGGGFRHREMHIGERIDDGGAAGINFLRAIRHASKNRVEKAFHSAGPAAIVEGNSLENLS